MEAAFGRDFGDITVSVNEEEELDALGASAVTDGTSVSFTRADPGPGEVAHELAHVVQRDQNGEGTGADVSGEADAAEIEAEAVAARVARGQESGPVRQPANARIHRRSRGAAEHPEAAPDVAVRYDAFVRGVYAAAGRIAATNYQAVEAWRRYTMDQLSAEELAGQVFATGFEGLQETAHANQADHLLAPYASERNPVRQSLYEHQMAGQWRACTGCHVAKESSAVDGRMREAGTPGVSVAELLSRHAGTGFSSGRSAALDQRLWSDEGAWDAVFAVEPRLGGAVDAPRSTPPPEIGPVRAPETSSHPATAPGDLGGSQSDSLAAARRAMARIQPRLQPLGDAGYKILPSNVISRFGLAPVEELRAEIQAAFDRRLQGYRKLTEKIGDESIDYLEFDSLLAMLTPMASPEVQALIEIDIQRHQAREVIIFLGLLLVDLLAIVVPPVAVVAGAMHLGHGIDQASTGADRASATGAHQLMSPERQASGPMMQMAGSLEAMGGALQLAVATSALAHAGGAGRVVSTRTQGDITLELLESGVVRGTHAAHPGKAIVMQPDGSFQALDELGNVVGTGAVGRGGGQGAANQAWGHPAPRPAGPTDMAQAPKAPVSPAPRALSPWPEISPFFTGGSGPRTFPPNQYNPSGRGDNCGFTSMSYAKQMQDPSAPVHSADDLYLQRLEQLGFTVDDGLSRQLVFPETRYDGLRSRPGYEALFDGEGGNRLSEYTVPNTAQALGLEGAMANDALANWKTAFGSPSLDEAVTARLEFLEERSHVTPAPAGVKKWIEDRRAELPGVYIVGSYSSAHYMTITISTDGTLTGFDPQSGVAYSSLQEVERRMGRDGFALMYKISGDPSSAEAK